DNTSLIDIFEQSFAKNGNKTAFVCMGSELTFQEVDLYSQQVAAYLQSLGLVKGDKVAVMMPNMLQLPVTIIGVLCAG
ncbi:AMP-binding protein, partial [Psychrobacter sp. GW64-MNA-CIBAN-0177]